MTTSQADLFEARQRGLDGARRAGDHADRRRRAWVSTAVSYVRLFVVQSGSSRFLAEDVRAGSEQWGMSPPPDARAWGYVMQRAKREGLIVPVGYAPAASSNGSPKVLWRKA